MSRHTPQMNIDPQTLAALQDASHCDDHRDSVRAGVLLALHAGAKVRDVAAEFSISPASVTRYRKKFEAGGIENLLSDASDSGRHRRTGIPQTRQVQDIPATPAPGEESGCDTGHIREEVQISPASAGSAPCAVTAESDRTVIPDAAAPTYQMLTRTECLLRGIYLSASVQIMAVAPVMSSGSVSLSDAVYMTYDSSDVEYREPCSEITAERPMILALQSLLSFRERQPGIPQPPADFVRTILNTPYLDGTATYFVLNAQDTEDITDIVPEDSCISTHVPYSTVTSIWKSVLNCRNAVADTLLHEIGSLLESVHTEKNADPFIWRSAVLSGNSSVAYYCNNGIVQEASAHSYIIPDPSGRKIICTAYHYSRIPTHRDFAESTDIQDLLSKVDATENALHNCQIKAGKALVQAIRCRTPEPDNRTH